MSLHEERVQIDLLLLRSYVNRCVSQVPDAADDLKDCLELLISLLLYEERAEWEPADMRKMLGVLARCATQVFLLGQYDECQWWLKKADEFLPQLGEDIDTQARIAWTRALL